MFAPTDVNARLSLQAFTFMRILGKKKKKVHHNLNIRTPPTRDRVAINNFNTTQFVSACAERVQFLREAKWAEKLLTCS
jgi:hypothetical protein